MSLVAATPVSHLALAVSGTDRIPTEPVQRHAPRTKMTCGGAPPAMHGSPSPLARRGERGGVGGVGGLNSPDLGAIRNPPNIHPEGGQARQPYYQPLGDRYCTVLCLFVYYARTHGGPVCRRDGAAEQPKLVEPWSLECGPSYCTTRR